MTTEQAKKKYAESLIETVRDIYDWVRYLDFYAVKGLGMAAAQLISLKEAGLRHTQIDRHRVA